MNKKALASGGVFAFLLMIFWGAAAFSADEPEGKILFLKNKCNGCHAVEGSGIEALRAEAGAPDLSIAAKEIPDAQWAKKFVLREVEKEGKKHKKPYKGSEKELESIISWLMTLKAS